MPQSGLAKYVAGILQRTTVKVVDVIY